jgi:hypothetical protein
MANSPVSENRRRIMITITIRRDILDCVTQAAKELALTRSGWLELVIVNELRRSGVVPESDRGLGIK